MLSFQFTTEVPDDRCIQINLPSTVPPGKVRLVVSVEPQGIADFEPRDSSLADWVSEFSENMGDSIRSDDIEGFTGRRY